MFGRVKLDTSWNTHIISVPLGVDDRDLCIKKYPFLNKNPLVKTGKTIKARVWTIYLAGSDSIKVD